MTLVERLYEAGVVPVIALPHAALAVPLAEALLEGGLRCAEITFRTDAAEVALPVLRERFPELLLGAGTVLTTRQADLAIDAGAEYLLAPGTNLGIVDHVLARGVPMIPGVATPTDIEAALSRNIDLVKFFPAEQFGGTATLKAFTGPYPRVRYIPTGGISPGNLAVYLASPGVVACGGSWMVKPDLLSAHDFATVTRLVREAVAIVAETRRALSAA